MPKPSILTLCSSSNLPTFIWPFTSIASPWVTTPRPRIPRTPERLQPRSKTRRSYATVHSDASRNLSGDPSASSQWPSCANPTPYQIFDLKINAPYSKARFYELVKIYHPDRHRQTPGDALTDGVRLERYRLIIVANEILSDPTKRRAYDLYGAGWGSIRSMDNSAYRHADKSWRNEPGNPSMNATWEDWERWYAERSGGPKEKQQTVFMSNELFVIILCVFVIIGSMGQARRASTATMNIMEVRDKRHQAISNEMGRRRQEQGALSRHERVESFLRQRDGWNVSPSVAHHDQQKR